MCPEQNDFSRPFLKSNIDIQIVYVFTFHHKPKIKSASLNWFDFSEPNEYENKHAAKVVEYYKKSKLGLIGFQRQWYEQFWKTMRPKYMSKIAD